jgi:nucleoside-diphosphate-sugar epimerase
MSPRRIGVTGAGGFIGRHLLAHLVARGDAVTAFQRAGAGAAVAGVTVRAFSMPDGIDPAHFEGLDAVVHGAVAEHGPAARDADAVNREGARRVLEAARAHGAHAVFLSTLSAHEGAVSHYGRCKLEVERLFDPTRDAVLRLGLVLGHGGLFGSMVDVIRHARVIPLPGGGRQPIQILWMGDLLSAVANVIDRRLAGRFDVAAPGVLTMRGLYESVQRGLGVRRVLVGVPLPLVELGVSVLEALRVPFPIRRENVLGLKRLRAFDTAPSMRALGIEHPVELEDAVRRLLEDG